MVHEATEVQPKAVNSGLVTDAVAGIVDSEWGFKDEDTLQLTHGIHPYPARMVPQVAKKLLSAYSNTTSRIWDPFCGSGTVLLESMIAGRHSIGSREIGRAAQGIHHHADVAGI